MALRDWMLRNIPDEEDGELPFSNEEQSEILGLDPRWTSFLRFDRFEFDRLRAVIGSVNARRTAVTVYPPADSVHRWSHLCGPDNVRVVIVGQDPYHDGSASGLAFGTIPGARPPPSLMNIYRELARSVPPFVPPPDGNLDPWCTQGVLLLNSVFTVEKGRPGSHENLGWQLLCDKVIRSISVERQNIVFMLWGRQAQEKEYLIDATRHLVLKSSHPSPKAIGARLPFYGNGHFAKANDYLTQNGKAAVVWSVLSQSMCF